MRKWQSESSSIPASSAMAASSTTAFAILIVLGFPLFLHFFSDYDPAMQQKSSNEKKNIEKRSVITFPPTSLFQINFGITLAGKLERNTGTIVLAFQQNLNLPDESQLLLAPPTARKFSIYDHLRDVITSYGINGSECLRKMVCQVAETPLVGGLLEDVFTLVLSPSKHRSIQYGEKSELVDELLQSERLGQSGGNCSSAFPQCVRTPLDFISGFAF